MGNQINCGGELEAPYVFGQLGRVEIIVKPAAGAGFYNFGKGGDSLLKVCEAARVNKVKEGKIEK